MSYRDDREAWMLTVDRRLDALDETARVLLKAKPKEPPESRTPWYLNHPLTTAITCVGLFAALLLIVAFSVRHVLTANWRDFEHAHKCVPAHISKSPQFSDVLIFSENVSCYECDVGRVCK